MSASHDCGHRAVYRLDCRRCQVLDLAGSPDVHVRAFLKRYREQHGRDAMQALIAEVQAERSRHASA